MARMSMIEAINSALDIMLSRDSGVVMPATSRRRMFEPYTSTMMFSTSAGEALPVRTVGTRQGSRRDDRRATVPFAVLADAGIAQRGELHVEVLASPLDHRRGVPVGSLDGAATVDRGNPLANALWQRLDALHELRSVVLRPVQLGIARRDRFQNRQLIAAHAPLPAAEAASIAFASSQ